MLAKIADALPTGPGFLFEPKWDGFRAIVFRGRRGDAAAEPRPEAAEPLLPRAREGAARGAAEGLRARRRDRRRVAARARLRRAPAAHPPGGVAHRQARRRRRRRASSPSTCSAPAASRRWSCRRRSGARGSSGCSAGAKPPLHLTPMTRDRAEAERWLAQFEGAGLDGVIAKLESARLPARQARDAEDQARAHAPTAWSPASAGTRTATTRSARCCSASTTTPACCTTSA